MDKYLIDKFFNVYDTELYADTHSSELVREEIVVKDNDYYIRICDAQSGEAMIDEALDRKIEVIYTANSLEEMIDKASELRENIFQIVRARCIMKRAKMVAGE